MSANYFVMDPLKRALMLHAEQTVWLGFLTNAMRCFIYREKSLTVSYQFLAIYHESVILLSSLCFLVDVRIYVF